MKNQEKIRCEWVGNDLRMQKYHDTVWGVPKKKDRDIFEAIVLDTHQAGLSWKCILHKRDNFAKAFHNFDAAKVAQMGKHDVARLMQNAGIIRNRLKIESTITNAKSFLIIQKEFGTFSKYIWHFSGGKTIYHSFSPNKKLPSTSTISDAMSIDLKKQGFKFVGSTICYAFMQGIGMVHDHTTNCFRYKPR